MNLHLQLILLCIKHLLKKYNFEDLHLFGIGQKPWNNSNVNPQNFEDINPKKEEIKIDFEIKNKGVTGGSRVKFVNQNGEIINLHKPHPSNIVKRYVIIQIIDKLEL